MKNIKIGSKLIISFLLIAALTVFTGIYLTNILWNLNENSVVVQEKAVIPMGLLVQTADLVQEMRVQAFYWKNSKTDEDRAAALKNLDKLHELLKEQVEQQKNRVIVEEGKKPLNNLLVAVDKFVTEVHNYTNATTIRCPLSGMTTIDFPPSLTNSRVEMREAVNAAIAFRTNSVKKLSEQNDQIARRATSKVIVIISVTVIVSIFIGIFLTFSITRPLKTVVGVISKMEKGDMTVRTTLEREDELGTLSKALDSLSIRLQTIFKNLHKNSDVLIDSSQKLSGIGKQIAGVAEANESQIVSVTTATEHMAVNIKTIANTAGESSANVMDVTKAIEDVVENINTMASRAEKASVNASEVAGATEQMSMNMNTIATAVEEMSTSISQISDNAGDARKVANEASVKSCEATSSMGKLGIAAKEIGQVTDVIKKIADKTNLLALNATIEAASAGAAGKGFAVVATEIKELANQSSRSADDIAQRIQGIQDGTNGAVTVINNISDIITKINLSVEAISNHVGQQTKASNEIASNVAQANIGTKRIAQSMGEVANSSKDIARIASQANVGARHVAESMEEVANGSKNIALNAGEVAKKASVVNQSVVHISSGAKEGVQSAGQINQDADELAELASDLKRVLSQFKIY